MNCVPGVLAGIFEENEMTRDIVNEESMFNDICQLVDASKPNLNSFANYLRDDCDLAPRVIFYVIDKLSLNTEFKTVLGKKLILLWLKYKSFEVFDILKMDDAPKRLKVETAIDNFDFNSATATLEELIKACMSSMGAVLNEEEIPDMKSMLQEGKTKEIELLFAPPPPPMVEYNPDKSIEEQLTDFIEDYRFFPDGSLQKVIQREQIIALLNKHPESKNFEVTKQILALKSEVNNFAKLEQAYRAEFGTLNAEAAAIFKKLNEKGAKEVYENICGLKSKVLPINVLELERLISKTNNAKKKIENKDVVFVLGTTGSGKSTNILKFLGYNLVLTTYKDLRTLVPAEELHIDHRQFYTSPQAKSCTRYINAAPIPDKFYKTGTPSNKKGVMICDSPGFGDNAGVEVDIANGVGMINALHGSKSVRVVALLAFDALTSNRMKGAIEIGEIISSLFHNISDAVDSIAIYFNKVPKDEIKPITNLILNKIDNLTETEKANEKLVAFLQILHEQSTKPENFINPFESNYQKLFQELIKMPPIQEVKKNFRYEFTDSTKREIANFVTTEKGKIKDYINNERYVQASFHLRMVEKIKNILVSNDKVQEAYTLVAKYIQAESLKQFKKFEEFLIEINNGDESEKLSANLKDSRRKLEAFQFNFRDFEELTPVSKEEIANMIEEYKERLLSEFKNLASLNAKRIFTAVKVFSKELAPELEKNVVETMNRQFNQTYKEVANLLEEKAYKEMVEPVKTLKSTTQFITQISTRHSSLDSMEKLKEKLKSQLDQSFEYINENIIKESQPLTILTPRIVTLAKDNLSYIEDIEALKIVEDSAEIAKRINECLKSIINKCKMGIRQLDSIDLSITQRQIDNNYLKALSAKKKDIELLMTISNVGEVLTQDYEYTKENINRKLNENVQILNNCIIALKSNKSADIERSITNIKKASEIVLKCSQIVDKGENSKKIAESISTEFLNYLSVQKQLIKTIEVRLNQMNEQSLQKIEAQYRKNETFEKMVSIDAQISMAVNDLKDEFNKILKAPFSDFLERQIPYLKDKKHYKFLAFSLERLEKLCYYAIEIVEIIGKEYQQISGDQKLIQDGLMELITPMRSELQSFRELGDISESPEYLKELLKTLISINSKPNTCIYLSRKLDFEVPLEIDYIKKELLNIKGLIEVKFSHTYESAQKNGQLNNLIKICRFYSSIEDSFKIKDEDQKINFKDLEKEITHCYHLNLKNDEEHAKALINGLLPTKISWSEVEEIYNQFYNLKTPDAPRKRTIIINQIKIIEKGILQQLKKFTLDIADNPDLIVKDKNKMNEFLDLFREAIEIEKQLKPLYKPEDQKYIQIKSNDLTKVGTNMVDVFVTEFDQVKKQLSDYNVTDIKQKINNFGTLETIIHSVFLQEDLENGENHQVVKQLKTFIEAKAKILNDQIRGPPTIDSLERKNSHEVKYIKLKPLLMSLQKRICEEIESKYDHYSDNFTIDETFKKYYINFMHPRDPKNSEHAQYLAKNVASYFEDVFALYKEKSNTSVKESNQIEEKINTSIAHLPSDLKQSYNDAFKKIKAAIKAQNDDLVQDLSKKIAQNPSEIENYMDSSSKAFKNGQLAVHSKLVEKLESIFAEKSRNNSTISDRISFINNYFIKMFERTKHFLDQDPEMFGKMKIKFTEELNRITISVQSELSNLKKFIESPQKAQEYNINPHQCISDIFKVHNMVIDLGDVHQQFKQKFIGIMEEKLNEIYDIYHPKLANQQQQNLSSPDILDQKKIKTFQEYVEYINIVGKTIEELKSELQKISVIQSKLNIKTEIFQKFSKIEKYTQKILLYADQIKVMIEYAHEYEFYDDRKKNMTMKQLEADVLNLDRTVEILKLRRDFFNSYILSEKSAYDFSAIEEKIVRRFNKLVSDSKTEVEDTFKSYNNDPASKVNLLMNVFRIMKEKKCKLIPKDELQQNFQDMSRLVRDNFESIRDKLDEKLKVSKQLTINVQKKIKVTEETKKTQITAVQLDINGKINTKTQEIQKLFNEKIDNQTDSAKKRQHENSKKTEINSFKNDFNKEKDEKIQQIEQKFSKIISEMKESLEGPIRELAESLTLYKKAVLDINYDNQKQVAQFEALLDQIPKAGPRFVKLIENSLDNNPKDKQSIGRVLLTTNKVFSSFVTRMINDLVRGKDINYVTEHLDRIILTGRQKMSEKQKETIRNLYLMFHEKYEELKTYYKSNPNQSSISYITTTCKDLGTQIKDDFYQKDNPLKDNRSKVQLLSGIFALWAIQKAEKFQEQVEFTMEPHPTQITTLILLLGIAHDKQSIENRLAQVGTGEGKSIVLAGLSSYLALCGFKVRCACYSSYLSSRDQSNFRKLFERLGVENDIKYGTFNQLCEDILNQGGSNFKKQVENMILEKPQGFFQKIISKIGVNLVTLNRGANKLKQNPTILVIDEVDVFFDDNYFGSTYCPGIKLKDPTVTRFLEYVWTEVDKFKDNIEPKSLIDSQQFSQLVDRYPSLKELLKNQVHGMIAGALSYKHDYFLIDKKLVYKDNDTISPNISYGYKTVFANIYEHYRNNVSRTNMEDALQISLMVAEFSYAMLPKYFDNILGVTGTLEVLPQYKKKQLQERYKIEDQYAIPSAFGLNKRRIDNYYIVSPDRFHETIINKIKEVQDKRPIIVFFKGARELNEFSQEPGFEPYLKRTSNLTEEHEASVRDSRIVRAVNADTITLMTNSFGRGTDFILLDQAIKEKGGLHIIHAFLSHEESEEVQIKGRTARQSNKGSYDCILNETWMEELNLTTGNFPRDANSDGIHNILLKAREDKIDRLSQSTLKLLKQSDDKHEDVVKIFSKESLAQSDLIDYVYKLNNYPEIRKINIKTVLGLDATGSMGGALKKTCEIIGTAFERAYQVLTEQKVKATIEIKIMVYRNYNSPFEEILETTAFENTPHNLRKFLERVGPKGGWGNEALEVFFQALNKEEKIDQVILIGDAAPNSFQEVPLKRNNRGENYWNSNGYPITNIDKELERFLLKRSPVHSFYLNAGAAFNSISKRTNGESSPFNLNSMKVADELTAFVVENVLKLIEMRVGKGRLNLVQTYRKMFT